MRNLVVYDSICPAGPHKHMAAQAADTLIRHKSNKAAALSNMGLTRSFLLLVVGPLLCQAVVAVDKLDIEWRVSG